MDRPDIVTPTLISPVRRIGAHSYDFDRRVAVMAIVNVTPDSFYDKGATATADAAIDAAVAAVRAGADWVDIGGVPFFNPRRPEGVSETEELDRVLPVVAGLRAVSDVVISVDTWRVEVARRAIGLGADVINDTSGLYDPELADLIAGTDATLVITHCLASPPYTPVPRPQYDDVVAEVAAFLAGRAEMAQTRGVPAKRIIVDPGHDLNKNTRDSLALTRDLHRIAALGYPTLVAVSNKHFLGEAIGAPRDQLVEATMATAVVCILQGARIVRVHNVREAVAAVRMTEAILGWRPPAVARHNLA